MPTLAHEAEAVFLAALERTNAAERRAYVNIACASKPELRERVERLLGAHEGTQGPLDGPPPGLEGAGDRDDDRIGTVIGPYKLLEQIGEGGMGTVYLARQTEPVKRLVALKIIKPGMDSKQVIARFEAERQALALMDHPNIAKVLDAGTVGQASRPIPGQEEVGQPDVRMGRPYFVMELVKGVPITKYCDDNHLTPRQRLELFVSVCHAVQHAHQKGIIHRDLKPSNVMVALYDDKPVPKVIDFGVAKATGQQLSEQTLHTGFGAVVGTVEYMSPEQASFNQLDVDTRSDVYTLGVLLYELLAGSPPFSRRDLEKTGMLEMLRVIREQEPSKPSTKLNTADGLPTLAVNRGTEPGKLAKLVRGDLDWIVMKALEKDRTRRYETAGNFARDIGRYLRDDPVEACPPSARYRFGKFARRNKAALTTTALVALALILGTGISAWQAIRATEAEEWAALGWNAEKTERARAVHAEMEERDAKLMSQRRLFDARLAQARAGRRSRQAGQRIDSLKAVAEATELADKLDMGSSARMALRNEAIACLGLIEFRKVHEQVARIPNMTDRAAFDPTLEHYAVNDTRGLIVVRRTDNNQEVVRLHCPVKSDWSPSFSPNGKWLVARLGEGGPRSVLIWDWRENNIVLETEHDFRRWCAVAWSPDSRQLAIGKSKSIGIFDLAARQEIKSIATPAPAWVVAFAPDGTRLAAGSRNNRQVHIYDVATGKVLRTLSDADTTIDLAWHPNGQLLVVAGVNDESIHVWDVSTGNSTPCCAGIRLAPGP